MNGRWCSYFWSILFPFFLKKCHSLKNVVIFPRELIYFCHSHSKAHTFFFFFFLWREISPMFWFPRWKWYRRRRRFLIPSSSGQPQLISCRCFAKIFSNNNRQTGRPETSPPSCRLFEWYSRDTFFFLRVSSVFVFFSGSQGKEKKRIDPWVSFTWSASLVLL